MNEDGIKENLKEVIKEIESRIDSFFEKNKADILSKELFEEEKNSILSEIDDFITIYEKLGYKSMGITRTEDDIFGETTHYTEDINLKYKIVENLFNMFSYEAIRRRLYNRCVKKIFIV